MHYATYFVEYTEISMLFPEILAGGAGTSPDMETTNAIPSEHARK